jgi:hypothetical protein
MLQKIKGVAEVLTIPGSKFHRPAGADLQTSAQLLNDPILTILTVTIPSVLNQGLHEKNEP